MTVELDSIEELLGIDSSNVLRRFWQAHVPSQTPFFSASKAKLQTGFGDRGPHPLCKDPRQPDCWLVRIREDLSDPDIINYARFKGSGTINGQLDPNNQPYKFMLWAGDKDPDTFRIKIWWEEVETEHVVYDNGFEGSGYETGQPISGGNIVVYTKK